MRKLRSFIVQHWRTGILLGVTMGITAVLLGFQLSSLTDHKLSSVEVETLASAQNLETVIKNPLFLPLKAPLLLAQHFNTAGVVKFRAVPVLFGGISALLFFILLRRFYTRRVAVLGVILFVSASWFLQTSRLISPSVLYLCGMCGVLVTALWLHHARKIGFGGVLVSGFIASLMYVPGFVFLLATLVLVYPKQFVHIVKKTSWWAKVIGAILFVVLMVPLAWAIFQHDLPVLNALGLPDTLIPLEWLKRLLVIPAYLFARGPLEPSMNVARLPLLDIFTVTLVVLGVFAYYAQRHQEKVKLLVVCSVFSILMIALNGLLVLVLLLPLCYMIATQGVALLLQQWFTVFPRNPLARWLGIGLLISCLSFVSFYHVKRYFVVWQHNPVSRAAFQETIAP